MFRAIWSKSLRDARVPILCWGLGLGLLMLVGFETATPVLLTSYAVLAPLFRFLGDVVAVQTPEGYITFRYLGATLPVLLSFWLIMAGASMLRGEEERGTLDVLLATPQPRPRLLLEKLGAVMIALLLVAVLFTLGAVAGEATLKHVDVVRALLTGLNLSLVAFFFGLVALLISQFTVSRGAAIGGASAVLLVTLLLDIFGREVNGAWYQYLSPFYYYNLNKPLIPSYQGHPWAALLLAGLCLLFAALSFVLFIRRDIGRAAYSLQRKPSNEAHQAIRSLRQAERAISTRAVSLHTFVAHGWSTFWWLFAMVLFSAYIPVIIPGIQKPFYNIVLGTPWLQKLFFDTPTSTNSGLLGTLIFTFMPALVIIFALTSALPWSADLESGRQELIFSTPNSRSRVLLERFGVTLLVVLLAPLLTWLALVIGAYITNLDIDQGRIAAASFTMLPPALITMGLVYALAGRLRHAAVLGLLTAYLVLAFLEESIEGAVQIPTWVMSLSIFHLYGNPIFLGMNWNNFLGMIGVAIVLLLIGLFQFRSVDIGKG